MVERKERAWELRGAAKGRGIFGKLGAARRRLSVLGAEIFGEDEGADINPYIELWPEYRSISGDDSEWSSSVSDT